MSIAHPVRTPSETDFHDWPAPTIVGGNVANGFEPSPISPASLNPQHHRAELVSTAHENTSPVATTLYDPGTSVMPVTGWRSFVPSSPHALSPQHHSVASALMPHVWSVAAATASQVSAPTRV